MKLQQFLNSNADTRVAVSGAGSAGMETMYYGPATAAAVSKMQVMYRAEVLTPGGLVNPTGYFGPSTMAKANSLCVAAPVDGGDDADDSDDSDDNGPVSLSGEGELVTFEIDDEEDTMGEGEEDVVVMVLTLEAEDGDVEVSRLGFSITPDTGTANEEDDAYDVFTEFSLWVDGDKIASIEADDEDEYLDEDAGTFRFSGLDLILEEDDETEVLVAVSVMNSVDGSDTANKADWNIEPTSVRYFDADGVATTKDVLDEMTAGDDSVHFDIEEEGTDDGAKIEGNSDTPDAATLLVDEDTDESDEYVVQIFDIEVDKDSGDLEVGDVYLDVTVADVAGGAGIAGGAEDVVDGIFMTIDGVTVEGEATDDVSGGRVLEGAAIAGAGSALVQYIFEFDQDVTLEGDEDYEVEVSMIFEGQDTTNYANGVTVTVAADAALAGFVWEVEGSANDNELTGSDTSETHTLATVVPVVTGVDSEVTVDDPNNSGTISFEFNVEADGEDDVVLNFGDITALNGATDDVRFTVTGTDTGIAVGSITKVSGDATLVDAGADTWTINDGDDATFAVDVTFTTVDAGDNGTYRVTLDSVGGVEIDETSGALGLSF